MNLFLDVSRSILRLGGSFGSPHCHQFQGDSTVKYRHTAIAALVLAMTSAPTLAQYSLITTIQIPPSLDNTNPVNAGGRFTSYDIAFSDPTTQRIYLADRSNASVDIFSAATNTYVGRLGGSGGAFTGQASTTATSGPDGVVVIPGLQVWAGDGNSTIRIFNIPGGAQPAYSPLVTGPISAQRVDEMIYDPNSHQVLAANNAASPSPFLSLISTTTGAVTRTIPFNGLNGTPNATNGIEQPAYDSFTNKFYVSVPQVNGSGPGGVAQLDIAGNVTHFFDFTSLSGGALSTCGPTGLAAGAGGNLIVGD